MSGGGLPAARPERVSAQVKLTVTSVLFQPFALAAGVRLPLIVGGVLSIFTAREVNVAVFPALSVTVTVPLTADPSVISTKGLGIEVEATPERLSVVVKLKETSVLFHPAALAAGLCAPKLSVGGVLSILIPLAVAVALTFPALSVQVPEAERLVPSALRVTGASQWSIPESVSAPVNVTVTLVLFQPFALAQTLMRTR